MRHVERGHPHLRLVMAAPRRTPLRLVSSPAPQATRRYAHRLAQLRELYTRESHGFFYGAVFGGCVVALTFIAFLR